MLVPRGPRRREPPPPAYGLGALGPGVTAGAGAAAGAGADAGAGATDGAGATTGAGIPTTSGRCDLARVYTRKNAPTAMPRAKINPAITRPTHRRVPGASVRSSSARR